MFVDFILAVVFIVIAAVVMSHFTNEIEEWAQTKHGRKIKW